MISSRVRLVTTRALHMTPHARNLPCNRAIISCKWIPQRYYKHTLPKSDREAQAAVSKNIRRSNDKLHGNENGTYLYGLKPVDFTVPPKIYPSPPPPPPKSGVKKYIFPGSIIVSIGTFIYFYMNNKNDAYEYWSAMQTGGTLPIDVNEESIHDKSKE